MIVLENLRLAAKGCIPKVSDRYAHKTANWEAMLPSLRSQARRMPPSKALRIDLVYWVPRRGTGNWNATHSGSDCNGTCNVEHILYNHKTPGSLEAGGPPCFDQTRLRSKRGKISHRNRDAARNIPVCLRSVTHTTRRAPHASTASATKRDQTWRR